jgi:hypothetical protein
MNPNFLLIYFFIFLGFSPKAQTMHILDGRDTTPVINAHVECFLNGQRIAGSTTSYTGKVVLDEVKKFDSLRVSHVGYTTLTVNYGSIVDIVYLNANTLKIEEVVLNFESAKTQYIGEKRSRGGTAINAGLSFQIVHLIENKFDQPKVIKSFVFSKLRSWSSDSAFFKIILFKNHFV